MLAHIRLSGVSSPEVWDAAWGTDARPHQHYDVLGSAGEDLLNHILSGGASLHRTRRPSVTETTVTL